MWRNSRTIWQYQDHVVCRLSHTDRLVDFQGRAGQWQRGDIAQACSQLRPLAHAETSLEVQRGKQPRPKEQPVVVDLSACPLRLTYWSNVRGVPSCPQLRTILDRGVCAALIRSSFPKVPATCREVSASGAALEVMRVGTAPLWANASPTTFTCLLTCRRAWHPINGVSLPDASPIQPVAGQGVCPSRSLTSRALAQPAPCSAMPRDGEPLHPVHVFYSTSKASLCQEVENVGLGAKES
jgi:hypothetical protein